MASFRSSAVYLILGLLGIQGCREPASSLLSSTISSSPSPDRIPDHLWPSLLTKQIQSDWFYQRTTSWQLQTWLMQSSQTLPGFSLPNWQTWYDLHDLKLLFHELYEDLGKEGRRLRLPLPAEAIDRILSHYRGIAPHHQKPRMTHILLNETALRSILLHYREWDLCYRGALKSCQGLSFSEGAAWIKTAWRRSGGDYSIAHFPTDSQSFLNQLTAPTWTESGTLTPDPREIYTLATESGAQFHLVGLHLMLKTPNDWFWTTLWLGSEAQKDFAADAPNINGLRHYRMCSIMGFQSALDQNHQQTLTQPIAEIAETLRSLEDSHWCSNPYLEHGINNQKTQCIGCHQWAGLDLSQREIALRLQTDLPSLLQEQETKGPSDFVWSLLKGSQPFIQTIVDSIEYFDAYDPYESLAD